MRVEYSYTYIHVHKLDWIQKLISLGWGGWALGPSTYLLLGLSGPWALYMPWPDLGRGARRIQDEASQASQGKSTQPSQKVHMFASVFLGGAPFHIQRLALSCWRLRLCVAGMKWCQEWPGQGPHLVAPLGPG